MTTAGHPHGPAMSRAGFTWVPNLPFPRKGVIWTRMSKKERALISYVPLKG